ncbi:MAG TPA: asparagine synthase (glutamine-hydrolyzing) [Ignavibacteriaceae bacterium]|nr:asparagine synthase (glutamine-hydrolyzing) [Ignavibacteriaceae bacterium]
MCGIDGVVSNDLTKRETISKINNSLTHRGPDNEGYYKDNNVALGQRRLSINDLSNGNQPISNEDGNLQLICNGEIYNSPELRQILEKKGHRFKTNSDVEVILHLYEEYGKDSVKYLRGMFAFALWDINDKSLFVGRDHLGQKPLFFYKNDDLFVFASEIKAILASGLVTPQIDVNGLWHYISLRYIPDQYTLFKNIHKLPAATWLFYKDGEIKTEKYWELKFNDKLPNDENKIEDQLDELLLDTVKLHLLSDVPLGTFLSGGIDSSTITAMVAKITKQPFPTFSIGVEENNFNELPYAQMVIDKYNLIGHQKVVKANLIDLIPEMIYHMDEPSDPFGVGVFLVSQLASESVKVVLGGDGGDENFAGYDRYAGNKIVDYYCMLPKPIRDFAVKRLLNNIPESFGYKSFTQKIAWLDSMSKYQDGERYAESMSFLRFTHEAKQKLISPEWQSQVTDFNSISKILDFFDSPNATSLVDKMLHTDLMTRIPDHLLVIADRMCMAHSLEGRSPLIDYKLVEFAASIPADIKLKGKNLKHILRKVSSRYLPKELVYREKQGFGFPIAIWMRTDLRDFLINLFDNSKFVELGIFNQEYINLLLDEHLSGKRDHNFRIWILLNLEIWYRIFFENYSIEQTKEFISSMKDKKFRKTS